MECNYVYRLEDGFGEGEAEYDAAEYPHVYCEHDGSVMLIHADLGDENNAKLKEFMATLTYTHG